MHHIHVGPPQRLNQPAEPRRVQKLVHRQELRIESGPVSLFSRALRSRVAGARLATDTCRPPACTGPVPQSDFRLLRS